MATVSVLLTGLVGFISYAVFYFATRRRPFPPGPPSLPILGVALKHPKSEFWKTYAEWGHKYGLESHESLVSRH